MRTCTSTTSAIWWLGAADGIFLGQIETTNAPVAMATVQPDIVYADASSVRPPSPLVRVSLSNASSSVKV